MRISDWSSDVCSSDLAEEFLDMPEPAAPQQLAVLIQPVGNHDVLQRLALLRDLGIGVAVPALHLVVVLDEQAVQEGIGRGPLLHQDQAPVLVETLGYPLDAPFALGWTQCREGWCRY